MTEKINATTPSTASASSTGTGATAVKPDMSSIVKTTLVEGAHDLRDGVKHLADDVVGQTKKSADKQLSSGKSKAVESLGSVANALRKTGEQLRADDNDLFTRYIDQAAQKVDVASTYLEDRSIPELVDDVKQFARREPALFLAGGLVIGLVGGRFLKSSTPEMPRATHASGAQQRQSSGQRQGQFQGQRQGQSASHALKSTPSAGTKNNNNSNSNSNSNKTAGASATSKTTGSP